MAKSSLGRGLNAILGEIEESYQHELGNGDKTPKEIEIGLIDPNPFQPRTVFDTNALEELAESIRVHGLLQPVLVVDAGNGRYTLIAGERRLRAHQRAKMETIKAVITDVDLAKLRELAIIENIQREDLNPVELAHSLQELLIEYGITHEKLAEIVKKSRAYVTNTLRLLSLQRSTQEYIGQGKISAGHAKVLVGLGEDDEREVVNSIIGQKLSVRQTEDLISKLKKETKNSVSIMSRISSLMKTEAKEAAEVLQESGFTNIKTLQNRLTITFENQNELDKFIALVKKNSH